MWLNSRINFCLALIIISLTACSSSQQNSDSGDAVEAASTSGADTVGSIPEDALSSEEGKSDATAEGSGQPNADGSDVAPPVDSGGEASPFADLTEGSASSDGTSSDTGSDSSASSGSGGTESYKVKAGDTLMKIAFSIYGDIDRWKDIYEMNKDKIKKLSKLKPGMTLSYEAPMEQFQAEELSHNYVIKQGDTLANIADDLYGKRGKYKKLQKYNSKLIKDPNKIFAGFTLYYDITEQEVAEAEARKAAKLAQGSSSSGSAVTITAPTSGSSVSVPSAISPPVSAGSAAKPVAIAPSVPAPASAAPQAGQVVVPPPPPPPAPAN